MFNIGILKSKSFKIQISSCCLCRNFHNLILHLQKINVKNAFDLQLIDYMTLMLKKKDSIMNDFSVSTYLSFFYLYILKKKKILYLLCTVLGILPSVFLMVHGAEIWMSFGIFRMTAHLHKNTQICTQHKIQTKRRIFWFWGQFHNQVYMFQDQSSAVMVVTKVNHNPFTYWWS